MTVFQVDGLANTSAVLFPCTSISQVEKKSGTCNGHLTLGLTYITMPWWIYKAFEEKHLAKSTGCKKSLRIHQDLFGEYMIYVCPSDIALPRLAFTFGNATFYISGKDYVTPKDDDAPKVVVELLGSSDTGSWELGAAFVQKFYMSYRERANITVYCHASEHCALNAVTNPSPLNDKWDSDALHDHTREYFGINTTSSASGSGSSSSKKSSTTDNEELKPPSPKTRNMLVIITVVFALFVMAVLAFYHHEKRKQHAAKIAANNGDAISTPVERG